MSTVEFSKKTATAVAHCKRGNGLLKVNGKPLEMLEPATLQYKVGSSLREPELWLQAAFTCVDFNLSL